MKKANKKQEQALLLLKQQYKKENKKKTTINKSIKNNNNEDSDEKEAISNEETVNIVLKIKDKEIKSAVNRMKVLKEENESLKNLLYEDEDYNNNIVLEDKNKEIAEKIQNYNKEILFLNRQLLEHNNCIEEQNLYNEDYQKLKDELKQVKQNILETKNKINTSLKNNCSTPTISNSNTEKSLQVNNANNKAKMLNKNNSLSKSNNKKQQKTLLPIIHSNQITSQSILTDNFMQKLKKYFDDDEDSYTILINKIKNIENNGKSLENKHKVELKQFNSQIFSLGEQFKQLSNNGKNSNSNIKVLKSKLNAIKGENKRQLKKINEIKKNLENQKNISKDKDYEISLLLGQINSLKNIVSLSDITLPPDGVSDYIEKIKEEKEVNLQDDTNEIEKEGVEIKKLKFLKNSDLGLQVDFPEGRAEDENIEETRKNIKNRKKRSKEKNDKGALEE